MPRLVVPILVPPEAPLSRKASSSRCTERIRVALSAMRMGLAGNLDALFAQPLDFGHQSMRVEHHAVADERRACFLRTTPGGQERQLVDSLADDEGMGRHYGHPWKRTTNVGLAREPVHDLALPLIAPLGAHDDDIGH